MFKCNLAMLRLTPLLALLALPIVLTRLLCFHQREWPPQSWYIPTPEAVIVSAFPIAWFFGFLYYTELPSLVFVIATVTAAASDRHWTAALVRSMPLGLNIALTKDRMLARVHQLHFPPEQRHMGAICLRSEPAHVLALQACIPWGTTSRNPP